MTRWMKLTEDDKWDFVMSEADTHRLTGGQVDGLRGLGAGGQSDWSLLRWGKLNLCSVLRYLDRWETFEVSWRGRRTWTLCLCFERSGQLRGICPDRVFDINRVKKYLLNITSGRMRSFYFWPDEILTQLTWGSVFTLGFTGVTGTECKTLI